MKLESKQRIALSIYFFLSGICFASWASRIPTIKEYFGFNDAVLGSILLAMPVGSIIGLPISGWLVAKFDSRIPLIYAYLLFALSLIFIGFSKTPFLFALSIGLFSFSLRILNIAINTQSIALQKNYKKRIVGRFHGLWSFGGVVGVGISTLMIKFDVSIQTHLASIALFTIVTSLATYPFTIKNDRVTKGNKIIFGKPDPFIFYLGMLVLLAAITEGGMYDWSGLYFKEVIKEDVFTYGYLIFMSCMTISRVFSDKLMDSLGMKNTYYLSASLVVLGISIAILFPYFWPAIIGFCLVGLGTAAIFPMTFLLAGKSKKYSPGMAISIISTYSIFGMLMGPPLIGFLSFTFGLKIAFGIFLATGLLLLYVSRTFFKYQQRVE